MIDEAKQIIESTEVLRFDLNRCFVRDSVVENILQFGEVDRPDPLVHGAVMPWLPIERVHYTWFPAARDPIIDLSNVCQIYFSNRAIYTHLLYAATATKTLGGRFLTSPLNMLISIEIEFFFQTHCA